MNLAAVNLLPKEDLVRSNSKRVSKSYIDARESKYKSLVKQAISVEKAREKEQQRLDEIAANVDRQHLDLERQQLNLII